MIDLRVPRTKEEIEANYEKRQAAHLYVDKLGKMEFSGLKLKSEALMQKVSHYKLWTGLAGGCHDFLNNNRKSSL